MVSSWLTKTSAAAICALAISGASAFPAVDKVADAAASVYDAAASSAEDAEQLHFDALGQMIWSHEEEIHRQKQSLLDAAKTLHANGVRIEAETSDIVHDVYDNLKHAVAEKIASLEKQAQGWATSSGIKHWAQDLIHESSVWIDGTHYRKLIHPAFSNYALRISTSGEGPSCDPDVKQYTGYLDVGQDKHFWFAFFESRSLKKSADKSSEPIMMWLNGGPGCSSTTGWLMEGVGPCIIAKNGTAVKYNEHSWTNKASVFFLDQPVNVGYSYSESGDVNNTPDTADDVYAFLNLFFGKYSEYADAPFHIAAESYGGRYAPLIASKIFKENKKASAAGQKKPINLESIMLGNGLTDPAVQFDTVYEYACESDYAIFEKGSPACENIRSKAKTCVNLIEQCYKYNSRLTCTPAGLYCWSGLYGDAQNTGRNLYDVRRKCDRDADKDGALCYRDELYVEKYLNTAEIKKGYGVPESVQFQACNMQVNQAFLFNGDGMHNSAAVLPELIADGIRVLVYAGEDDFMCNYIGNVGEKAWGLTLDHEYQEELIAADTEKWSVGGKKAGSVRKAGKGAGNFALVRVADAGHMVPYDQPAAAEALIGAWLANKSIA